MYYEIRRNFHPSLNRPSEFIKSFYTEKEAQEHCINSSEKGVYFDSYEGYKECDY